jgi:hypothetical protein
MSTKYPGGFITKSPVAPTTSAASGIWTLDQQQQAQKAGTWPSPPIFIEDLFSTYLYTGTDAAVTINNGIDLSTKGGMIWWKSRSNVSSNLVQDTTRGITKVLRTNTTDAETTETDYVTATSTTGFSVGASLSVSPRTYVTWTFAKQPKFFDVVTYSGSNSTQTISHNLGSAPGCIMIKKLDSNTFNAGWAVYHRSLTNPNNYYLVLNTDAAETNYGGAFISSVSSTTFTVAGNAGQISLAGSTYVAYLFAHDAGGFPVSGGGSTNGISCGSYTGSGGVDTITLGYEPQWILMKATAGMPWRMFDTMRGMSYTDNVYLDPSTSDAEVSYGTSYVRPTPTGFTVQPGFYGTGATVIYIAIRRGPMKTPTVGTSVFSPNTTSDDGNAITTGFPVDMFIEGRRAGNAINQALMDRLRGNGSVLTTSSTAAENPVGEGGFASNTTIKPGLFGGGTPVVVWNFRRAPSFFDEVCYTGTGSATTFTHNLGVAPQLMIVKQRSAVRNWPVYTASTATNEYLVLNGGDLPTTATTVWNNTAPTSSVFSVGTSSLTNASAGTYVAYLFATCAGVSKVGSYTGTGALQTINCGFTSGARFVLIKLISSGTSGSGDWYVWDSARGISSSNDPYLLLNSTSAEQTGTNFVDTTSVGFQVTAAGATDINASGDVYLFLAIA